MKLITYRCFYGELVRVTRKHGWSCLTYRARRVGHGGSVSARPHSAQHIAHAHRLPITKNVTIDVERKNAGVPWDKTMNSIITAVANDDHLMVPTRPSRSSEHGHIKNVEAGGKAKAVKGRKHRFILECLVYVQMYQVLAFTLRTPVVNMWILSNQRSVGAPTLYTKANMHQVCHYDNLHTCGNPSSKDQELNPSPRYRVLTPSVITHPGPSPLQAWH